MVQEESDCAAPPGGFMVAGGEEPDSTRTDSLARCQVNSRHARRSPGSARQPSVVAGARSQGRSALATAYLIFTARQGNQGRQVLSSSRPGSNPGAGIRSSPGSASARRGHAVAQRGILRSGRCQNPGQGGQIHPAIRDAYEGGPSRGSGDQAETKPNGRGARCGGAGESWKAVCQGTVEEADSGSDGVADGPICTACSKGGFPSPGPQASRPACRCHVAPRQRFAGRGNGGRGGPDWGGRTGQDAASGGAHPALCGD